MITARRCRIAVGWRRFRRRDWRLGCEVMEAAVSARRGMGYRQIVDHYFPGTSARNSGDTRPMQAKSMEFRLQPGFGWRTRKNPAEAGTPCSTPYGASFSQLAHAAFSLAVPASDSR